MHECPPLLVPSNFGKVAMGRHKFNGNVVCEHCGESSASMTRGKLPACPDAPGEVPAAGSFAFEAILEALKNIDNKLLKAQKKKALVQASNISDGCRGRHLKIYRVPPSSKTLKSFGNPLATKAIEDAVTEFSEIMLAHHLADEIDEKSYIQKRVQDVLWVTLKSVLRCGNSVSLVNEKPYELKLDDEESEVTITGKTDHVVKMDEADASLLTIEDKNTCKAWSLGDLAQAHSQALFEVNILKSIYFCEPEEYVGVLVNGRDWTFLCGQLVHGRRWWTYVKLRPTFDEGNIVNKAIKEVARFLEHALVIVDELFEYLSSPRTSVPTMSLLKIVEGNEDSDDEDLREDDSDEEGGGGPVKGPPGPPPRDKAFSSSANHSRNTRMHKHGMGKKKLYEVQQQQLLDEENHHTPLTYANMKAIPERPYKII
eukprot:gene28521-34430_t